MCRVVFATLIGCLALLPVGCSGEPAIPEQEAKKNARDTLNTAYQKMMEGKYEGIADSTEPNLVLLLGGYVTYVDQLKKQMDVLKTKGITFTRYTVGEPTQLTKKGDKLYVIVPISVSMKGPTQAVTSHSSMLGISKDQGKAWTFIHLDALESDGKTIMNTKGKTIFEIIPDFPKDLKLPPKGAIVNE
jgi:hypothetical protein